jgi:hypothetical protein
MRSCLLDFFVHGIALEYGVVLFDFEASGRIFAVFGGDVARHTRKTRGFMLCAFEDYLNAIFFAFLSHDINCELLIANGE